MTLPERPRVYRATRLRDERGGETSFARPVALIRWDRERVVPWLARALDEMCGCPADDWLEDAEAIFDALDQEGT